MQLGRWKIIDYIAVPIKWETRSAVARNCCAQNLTDHWPVLAYVRLPVKKEKCLHEGNSALKGWRAKAESDETGFGRVIVKGLEAAEDKMGDVSVDDITECSPKDARAVGFESAGGGGGNKLVKKTKEHIEAEKTLRGRTGEELKLQKVKNKTEGCHTLYYENERGTTWYRQKWEEGGQECEHIYADVYTLPSTKIFLTLLSTHMWLKAEESADVSMFVSLKQPAQSSRAHVFAVRTVIYTFSYTVYTFHKSDSHDALF